MKIVLFDSDTVAYSGDIDLSVFAQLGELEIYKADDAALTAERIADADAVLCNKTMMTAENMANAKSLKYVGLFATGYNNVDLEYCDKAGITVCNAGSYSTDAVAQHTFALILDRFSRVAEYNTLVQEGGWIKSPTFSPFVLPTEELAGKTIGIIGYGSIGRAVAEIALAFRMRVLVYNRSPKDDGRVEFVGLDALLENSDIITAHCPLNEQSRGMFNKSAFDKMKQGAFFVNTSRGPVVDEAALRDALQSGKITAAVDVLEYEPMRENCPLYNEKGIVITPHVAWAPLTTRQRLIGIVYDNLKRFMENKPQNVVNNPKER